MKKVAPARTAATRGTNATRTTNAAATRARGKVSAASAASTKGGPTRGASAKGGATKGGAAKTGAPKTASGKVAGAKAASAEKSARGSTREAPGKGTPKGVKPVAPKDGGPPSQSASAEGWHGWDDYAAFYDWENARTVGRRDIVFWRDVALRTGGRTLELGCGTGRILAPLARQGVDIVGIDRSVPMLARAQARVKRLRRLASAATGAGTIGAARRAVASDKAGAAGAISAALLRGDIRQLPFDPGSFDLVMAPYGILQSLVRERDLTDTLRAVFAALAPGGRFGLDLVPDVPRWQEYARRVSMRGRRGPRGVPVTLVESVRQDRAKGLTIFDQEFIEGHGKQRRVHQFSLTFRTVSIQSLRHRLERAGFLVDAVLGGYDGRPWDPRADTWVLMASKPA